MKSSLSAKNTFLYIKKLLESYLPDSIQNNNEQLEIMVNDGLDRLEFSFSKVKDKYFNENGIPVFNHLNSDHMVVLIYYIGNSGFRSNCDKNLLEKIYYLNKILHSVDIFYSVELPDVFCVAHPLGTILGHAKYGNYLHIYQNVTIGSTNEGIYPTIGEGVAFSSNTSAIGDCTIGNNVLFTANSFIINKNIPDNSLVTGHYPNNRIIPNKKPVIERLFEKV